MCYHLHRMLRISWVQYLGNEKQKGTYTSNEKETVEMSRTHNEKRILENLTLTRLIKCKKGR